MKTHLGLPAPLLLALTFLGCGNGPIYTGNLVLSTEQDLEAARMIEEVEGNLVIEGSGLTDLTGLENLEWVGNSLIIGGDLGNRSLINLEGLAGLQRVEVDVTVRRNPRLSDLTGLRGLVSVGGSVGIAENDGLTTIGMTSLTTVDFFVAIDSNYALTSVDGLESLSYVDFTLGIDANSALTNLRGLRGLRSVGRLYIRNNGLLPSCAATGLRDQVEALGGFTRYDMGIEIDGNDDEAACAGGPLGG